MRLFIAMNFDKPTKDRLLAIQQKLKACGTGNFTRPENLHLTLVFLGEVQRYQAVVDSINRHFSEPIPLSFRGTGTFRGDLYWVGITPNPALNALHQNLCQDLRAAGYRIEQRRFSPHITLGREVVVTRQPDLSFEPFSMTARRISLMKSERIQGILTYTEIYGKSV